MLNAQWPGPRAFKWTASSIYAHAVAVLRAQGRSPAEIEELFRRDVEAAPARLGADAVELRDCRPRLKEIRALTQQQRELAWLTVPAEKYAAEATPDDAALKAYFEAHKADYMTPETVDLRYVEISLGSLAAQGERRRCAAQNLLRRAEGQDAGALHAARAAPRRHILLSVTDPKDDAAVKAKAEGILKRAQAGEDFGKLAKEFSQDPGSAPQGGDLGLSERKVWVAPFGDAAFSMKVDEIRGPVKTQFGYHILKLDGIQPATVKTFEQAQDRTRSRVPAQRSREACSTMRRTSLQMRRCKIPPTSMWWPAKPD